MAVPVFQWGVIVLYNADFVLIRLISKIFSYVLHHKLADADFKKAETRQKEKPDKRRKNDPIARKEWQFSFSLGRYGIV